ncbi:MAG TPA: ATP-binding protein [Candidatus Sericytochromatia bacterium]
MAKLGQSSFRRILLSRLLLLSVPVLLAGVYVTYKKARSTLLDTARQNLKESAVRKGERIHETIAALQANLLTASESVVLQSQSAKDYQRFITKLAQQLPTQIQCVQLSDVATKAIAASTCGARFLTAPEATLWPQQIASLTSEPSKVYVTTLLPQKLLEAQQGATSAQTNADASSWANQLKLLLSAPVYNSTGQLRYILSIQSAVIEQAQTKQGSLSGYLAVINQKGTILTHPYPERVGRNIEQETEAAVLKRLLNNAIAGRQDFEHLFSFERNGVELLAGYTSIKSPITAEADQKWVILAISPLNSALVGLKDIQQALFILTCCLIAASFLATAYVARDLARPLEKLRDYALNESTKLHSTDRMPHNLKIREFNQLSEALDGMVERLRDWAEELETAWKEAQAANQLKNEFLANTSHELRTPLNGIIGCLRLVRDGFCDDREEELDFLQRADDAAIHLLGIINDVLDIAKIEAGKLTVEVEPVDLRKLLNEVINLQAVPIQQKGLEFDTTDLHEVIAVRVDPAKLKQVLLNVVGNAVKFTDTGSITISTRIDPLAETPGASLKARPQQNSNPSDNNSPQTPTPRREKERATATYNRSEEKGSSTSTDDGSNAASPGLTCSQVVVTVKDTGIGIDPTQQQKLFRPFVMVDGSTTRKVGGTGLGLAISRNLIELMGGTITLFSHGEGEGTTVEITLPTIEPSLLISAESLVSSSATQKTAVADNLAADSNGAVTHTSRLISGE